MYTIVAAAFSLRVGILVVITLSVQRRTFGLQQTQAGNAPTLVRQSDSGFTRHNLAKEIPSNTVRGGAVWVRYTEASCVTHSRTRVIATPKSNRL